MSDINKIKEMAQKEMEKLTGKPIDPDQVLLDSITSQYNTQNKLEKIQVKYTIERHREEKGKKK